MWLSFQRHKPPDYVQTAGLLCSMNKWFTEWARSHSAPILDSSVTSLRMKCHISSNNQPWMSLSWSEGNIGQQLQSGDHPPTPRCEVLCQGMYDTGVVIAVLLMIPSGYQAAPSCIYAYHLEGALWVVTVISPLHVGLIRRKHDLK
jgi:hypothetical protein